MEDVRNNKRGVQHDRQRNRPTGRGYFTARERQRFLEQNPKSVALAERAHQSLYAGVPMHWMADWSTPCPLFVERAQAPASTT